MSTNPARLCRAKRISREETEDEAADPMLPTVKEAAAFTINHRTAVLAAFVIAWVWFDHVVAPLVPSSPHPAASAKAVMVTAAVPPRVHAAGLAMATGSLGFYLNEPDGTSVMASMAKKQATAARAASTPSQPARRTGSNSSSAADASDSVFGSDVRAFVVTCALVHTLVVSVGLALGRDTLSMREPSGALLRVGVSSFCFMVAVLWWAWEYKIGPVPVVAERLFSSEGAFVLIGALQTTAWLTCSMAVPHSPLGAVCTGSNKFHLAIALLGLSIHAMELSARSNAAIFGVLGCAGLAAAEAVRAGRLSGLALWNL